MLEPERTGQVSVLVAEQRPSHSARNASSGEIRLARNAGISDATSAENPSARTAANVTTGLYGFIP